MRHKAAAGNNNQWEVWIALHLNSIIHSKYSVLIWPTADDEEWVANWMQELLEILEKMDSSVVGQAGKRAWADAANECHCSLYLRARCKD